MKKFLRSVVTLLFCLTLIASTATVTLAVGKVTGAKATAVTYNSATLTWKKVKGADGYQVRSYVDKKYSKTVDAKKKTEYKFKLTPGKSYSLEVRAYERKIKKFKTVYEYSSWVKVKVKAVPTQVKNLKGTQSGNSVKLSWSKVSGATGYTVQQYVSKKWKTIKNVTKNSYTVTKQKYQTTQKFRVCAYSTYKKKNYSGDYSSTVSVTLATPAPSKVANLKATQSAKNVKLTWTAISGATGYEVQQYVSKKWKTVATVTTNTHTVKNQAYQSTQQFRVRAYKMYDKIKVTGAYSSTVKITIATPAPSKVANLKATQSAKSVKLTWTAISGVKGYTVQQYVSKNWKTIATVTTNSYTVTNQAYQSTQQFRVCAYKMYDKIKVSGAYSSTVKITIATPAPAAVTNFKAVHSANSAKLTWTAVSGAAGYTVQQYKSSKWETIKTVTTNSLTVSSLTYGSTYKFRVCAYKMYDSIKSSSAYTSEASVTIAVAKPSTPKLSSVATTSAKLTWGAVTGATGYEVYDNSTGKTTTVKTNSISLSSLKSGTSYSYKVRSYAGSYKSAYTSNISFKTVPAKVANFKVSDVTDTTATASWSASTGCTNYEIQRYDAAAKKWVSTTTAGTSVALSALKANTEHKFRVRGSLKDGSTTRYSAWSSEVTIKTMLGKPAITKLTADQSSYQLDMSWSAVEGAAEYVLEYYNSTTCQWDEVEKLTQTSYQEDMFTNEPMFFRVYSLGEDGTKGYIGKAFTIMPSNITVSCNNFYATATWGDTENTSEITMYEVRNKNAGMGEWRIVEKLSTSDLDSYKVALTPGTANAFEILAYYKNGSVATVAKFAVDATDFIIDNTDESKSAQLLFLTNAINKTKSERTTVTSTLKSSTNMKCNVLKIGGPLAGMLSISKPSVWPYWSAKEDAFILDSPEKITKFMSILDESTTADDLNTTESLNETHTFTNGFKKISAGKYLYLDNFIEPTGAFAYIYNQNNAATWKNGFSTVNTVKNTDGTYTLNATLKAEKFGSGTGSNKAFYHSGFASAYDSLDFGDILGDSGNSKNVTVVGATTISAKITADGRLISYNVDSPVKMDVDAAMSITDEEGATNALTFATQMSGKITLNYTFTR